MSYRWIGLMTGAVIAGTAWGLYQVIEPRILFSGVIALQASLGYYVGKKFEQMQKMAYLDSLTEVLVNRRFFELLEKEVERAKRQEYCVTLMFIDLDNFKKYNDKYGHLAGDRLLSRFAKFLKENVRDQDSVGRWGGEEFVTLLPHTDARQGIVAGRRIQDRLRQEMPEITVSIGLATFPFHALSAAELAARADALMYEAKKKKDCLLAGPISS